MKKFTIDYKGADYDFRAALARALNVEPCRVEVRVTPPSDRIPLRCEWAVVCTCPDAYVIVDGAPMSLNIV